MPERSTDGCISGRAFLVVFDQQKGFQIISIFINTMTSANYNDYIDLASLFLCFGSWILCRFMRVFGARGHKMGTIGSGGIIQPGPIFIDQGTDTWDRQGIVR